MTLRHDLDADGVCAGGEGRDAVDAGFSTDQRCGRLPVNDYVKYLLTLAGAEVCFGAVERCGEVGGGPLIGVGLCSEGFVGGILLGEDAATDVHGERAEIG